MKQQQSEARSQEQGMGEEGRAGDMQLSTFFSGINVVWSSYSFPWLGMVAVVYIGIAYAANRFASTRQSSALLYGVYAFAFFFVFALLSTKSFDALLHEPLLIAMVGALGGAGVAVYRRLHIR